MNTITLPTLPIAVAVSGGPDSMALCHYLLQNHTDRIVALTVDHGLRPESKAEAVQVHEWLTRWGVDHHVLSWEGVKPQSRLQERARQARYHLLGEWCQAHDIKVLATAHHQLDQAETVLMRLMKGSGRAGLAGMSHEVQWPWGALVRPFLEWTREDIDAYISQHSIPSILDPSNANQRFERVRWRHVLQEAQNQGHGLTEASLLALQQEMRQLQPEPLRIDLDKMGAAIVPYDLSALSQAIRLVGGKTYPPAVSSLTHVLTELYQGKAKTLGGCLLKPCKDFIRVTLEVDPRQKITQKQ